MIDDPYNPGDGDEDEEIVYYLDNPAQEQAPDPYREEIPEEEEKKKSDEGGLGDSTKDYLSDKFQDKLQNKLMSKLSGEGAGAAAEGGGAAAGAGSAGAEGGAAAGAGASAGTAAGAGGGAAAGAGGGAAAGAGASGGVAAAGVAGAPETAGLSLLAAAAVIAAQKKLGKGKKKQKNKQADGDSPEKKTGIGGCITLLGACACCSLIFVGPLIFVLVLIFGFLGLIGGGDDEAKSGNAASQFATVEKKVSISSPSVGPAQSVAIGNTNLPNTAKFEVKIKAASDITGLTCTDVPTLTRSNNSVEQLPALDCSSQLPSQLSSGQEATLRFDLSLPDEERFKNSIVNNSFTLSGTGQTNASGSLDYWIPFRDSSTRPFRGDAVALENFKNLVRSRYPSNLIDANCFGQSCWDYVVSKAIASGTDPTFVLAVWYEEAHFSDTGNHFSCPVGISRTHDAVGLRGSLDCLLNDFVDSLPNTSDGFLEFLNHYCGTGRWENATDPTPTCHNNPNFLPQLKLAYPELGGTLNSLSSGSSGQAFSTSASATIIIGNPPSGPPAFSVLQGNVAKGGGYDFLECTNPDAGCTHLHPGLDFGSTEGKWDIYSPFAQPAQVIYAGGTCSRGPAFGYGQYMIVRSGDWEVLISHFACGSFTVSAGDTVNSTTRLGVAGLTGYTTGMHIHYEVHHPVSPLTLVNPRNYGALTPHP